MKGFTLMELLIVILIIGILSAVAFPKYQLAVDKSKYNTLMHLVDAVAREQELYYLANGSYSDEKEIAENILPSDFTIYNSYCYANWKQTPPVNICIGPTNVYGEPFGGGKVQYIRYYENAPSASGSRVCRVYLAAPDADRWKKLCSSLGRTRGGAIWETWDLF